jgi:hypothetical protein
MDARRWFAAMLAIYQCIASIVPSRSHKTRGEKSQVGSKDFHVVN